MKKRKQDKIIVGTEILLLCMIIGVIGTNAASIIPPSNQVSYNKNSQTTVQSAINDLYTKLSYGDAASNEIVNGKTALVGGKQVVGTYTCPSVASQTPGDATPEDITEGKIAWVNGNKIVGTRTTLANKVEIGDYIRYTPIKKDYIVLTSESGYKYDQTIPISGSRWLVLNKTSNGTVEIVLATNVGNSLIFGGDSVFAKKTAYKNYIGVLNNIAKQYENPEYTISSRSIGYDRALEKEYLTDTEIDNGSGIGYQKDESLLNKALGTSDKDLMGEFYWLASRSTGNVDKGYFYVHYMGHLGSNLSYTPLSTPLSGGFISQSSSEGEHYARAISVVELKSTLKITGGNGTKGSPYTLGT